ncbi:MAG TPA: mandelate racemase/muconate lactonizing enzyme family protein [bacterium]|nr:mandelate racemase/muconate lactonizing enzyme family protein [bacterium]
MQITDLRAMVVRIPRGESLFSGGAGVRGHARPAPESLYQIIEPYPTVYSTAVETLLVHVDTDDGVTGIGEAQFPVAPEAGAVLAERLLRPLLLGKDPLQRESLYYMLYSAMHCRGHVTGMYLDVVAAVDNALWDLSGRAAGQPVWHLLGGHARDRIPVYVSGLVGHTREDRIREALEYRAQGFEAIKIFGGHGVADDTAEAAALREALGPEVALCVDVQWMYDPETAVHLGRELERLGVTFFETPVEPEDIAGTAAVARALHMPVAGGECERTRYQFTPWLDAGALDIVQVDVGRCGTTEGCNIALLAKARHRPLTLHLGVGLFGYIAASLQVAAWAPGLLMVEYQPQMVALASGLLEQPFRVDAGRFVVPEGPGAGFTPNTDALEPYLVRPRGGRWRDVAG